MFVSISMKRLIPDCVFAGQKNRQHLLQRAGKMTLGSGITGQDIPSALFDGPEPPGSSSMQQRSSASQSTNPTCPLPKGKAFNVS